MTEKCSFFFFFSCLFRCLKRDNVPNFVCVIFQVSCSLFCLKFREWPKLNFHIRREPKAEEWKIFDFWPNTKAEAWEQLKAEYLEWNFCGQSWRPNSEKLWLRPNTSAFGEPLLKSSPFRVETNAVQRFLTYWLTSKKQQQLKKQTGNRGFLLLS